MNATEQLIQETKQQPVTTLMLIKALRSQVRQREIALKAYHNPKTVEKQAACLEILEQLDYAATCISDKQACKVVLKTALNLHFIAPTGTKKLFATYYETIESILEAMRMYIGWRKQ